MKIEEIMEKASINQTGLAISLIKDALTEMNLYAETHVKTERININKNQRFYRLPSDMVRILDVRCKNQLNGNDEYRSIPRAIGNVTSKDSDGK